MYVFQLKWKMMYERKEKLPVNKLVDLQRAAISLGRSAPNLPNRLLLASRSNGEWLLMELKAKG